MIKRPQATINASVRRGEFRIYSESYARKLVKRELDKYNAVNYGQAILDFKRIARENKIPYSQRLLYLQALSKYNEKVEASREKYRKITIKFIKPPKSFLDRYGNILPQFQTTYEQMINESLHESARKLKPLSITNKQFQKYGIKGLTANLIQMSKIPSPEKGIQEFRRRYIVGLDSVFGAGTLYTANIEAALNSLSIEQYAWFESTNEAKIWYLYDEAALDNKYNEIMGAIEHAKKVI